MNGTAETDREDTSNRQRENYGPSVFLESNLMSNVPETRSHIVLKQMHGIGEIVEMLDAEKVRFELQQGFEGPKYDVISQDFLIFGPSARPGDEQDDECLLKINRETVVDLVAMLSRWLETGSFRLDGESEFQQVDPDFLPSK